MSLKAATLLTTLALSGAAFAQAAAPAPDYTLSYNVGVVTDYRYRGISQTARKPALQGGADLAFKSGFYVGTWASTIRWIEDTAPGLDGPVEIDIYGGYKGALTDSISFDVGGLQYWYPGNDMDRVTGEDANTFELYGALSSGPFTVKYSHSLTHLFGTANSEGSGYLDLSATFDLGGGMSLVPHVGWQRIKNFGTYRDYSLTLSKDFSGVVGSVAVVGTNWEDRFGIPYTLVGSGNKDLGKAGLVLGAKYSF